MLPLLVRAQIALWAFDPLLRRRGERGQTTAEYALVLLGAAAVALLVVAWAANSEKIGRLLNAVLDKVIEQVT